MWNLCNTDNKVIILQLCKPGALTERYVPDK